MYRGAIIMPPHPGLVTLRVSTLLAWRQALPDPLFSDLVRAAVARKGLEERHRIGWSRAFTVEATAADSTSYVRAHYYPGEADPEWIEHDERTALTEQEANELGLLDT